MKNRVKFLFYNPLLFLFDCLLFSRFRISFLRLMGAQIGDSVFIGKVHFVNAYRAGFKALKIGDHCVIDDYVILDLANSITLENHVTIAFGSIILTHLCVGPEYHPLHRFFPETNREVLIKKGSFIGAHSTLLNGVTVGESVFIGAHSLLQRSTENGELWGGVPARLLRKLKEPSSF